MKLYPVEVQLKVHITDGDIVGSVNYGCGLHHLPTTEEMPGIIETVTAALPPGYRLMSRHESTMHFLREERAYRGPNLALPNLEDGKEWHDPAAANTFSALRDEPDEEDDEL